MEGQEIVLQNPNNKIVTFTVRDFAAMAFRRSRTLMFCFFGILLGSLLAGLLWPSYRAETEILVRRQRVDPVVSSQQTSPLVVSSEVSEEELNSEVELITNEDVLRKVVQQVGLNKPSTSFFSMLSSQDPEVRMAKAVRNLRSKLGVDSLPKTDVIRITYSSRNPAQAAQVLSVLDSVYLQKHAEVQRAPGQFDFFNRQVEVAKTSLEAAEDKLKAFPQQTGTANPTLSRDITLQKVNDMNMSLAETQAAIAESKKKIDAMEQLSTTTAPRVTTQMRQLDDAPVLQQMKSTLLALQLKQSDMASKYAPDYPPLQELNREVANTQAEVNGEKPLSDVTTDQNPAYSWMSSELVKDKSELRGYEAKATETEQLIRQTLASAQKLDVEGVDQQDLVRAAKAAEESYLLYLRKREEARITDALDAQRILNVAISEQPTVPTLPSQSLLMYGAVGIFLAITISAGAMFTLEYLDPSFHTPAEVEIFLNRPVLAAVPDQDGISYRLYGFSGKKLS
jgi:uncharacterized protein involved in exopolysaccharide biosynthesis